MRNFKWHQTIICWRWHACHQRVLMKLRHEYFGDIAKADMFHLTFKFSCLHDDFLKSIYDWCWSVAHVYMNIWISPHTSSLLPPLRINLHLEKDSTTNKLENTPENILLPSQRIFLNMQKLCSICKVVWCARRVNKRHVIYFYLIFLNYAIKH